MLRTNFIKHHNYTYAMLLCIEIYYRGEFPKESSRRRKQKTTRLLIRHGTIRCLGLDNSGVTLFFRSRYRVYPGAIRQSGSVNPSVNGKNEIRMREIVYLASVLVFLRKPFCSQQAVEHSKIHLQRNRGYGLHIKFVRFAFKRNVALIQRKLLTRKQ